MIRISPVRIAILVGAGLMLLPSAALASCAGSWDLSGYWRFVQSNDTTAYFTLQQAGNVITGTGSFTIPAGRGPTGAFSADITGSVNGSINGSGFNFIASWYGVGTSGEYTGVINAQGKIAGNTHATTNPDRASWHGDRVAKCIVASTAPPPVNTAPPIALGRVTPPPGASPTTSLSICDRARDARARNSPTAPALEAQCRATAADLSVVSVSGPSPLRAGLSGTYTVIIKNSGNVSAAIDLHIVFAKALDQTGQIVAGAGLACAIGHDAGINTGLTCTGGQLAAGATTTVTVQGRGQTAGVGILLATINPSHVAQESNYDNNMYQLNVTIN
jgi:hypothetical protein